MARIRSIKPEFFTSDDIVSMTPLARLFYIALWCEADREGRMEWKPRTFKLRYLPAEQVSVDDLTKELTDRGLVVLYFVGDKQYADIPTFTEHQVINNREVESTIPTREARVPHASPTRAPRVKGDASTRAPRVKAEGKEGKGREGREGEDACTSTPSAPDGAPPQISAEFQEFIRSERPDLDAETVFKNFIEHYPSEKHTEAKWRKWVRTEFAGQQARDSPAADMADPDSRASVEARGVAVGLGRWDELSERWDAYKARVIGAEKAGKA